MSRFLRLLITATAVAHLAPAMGIAWLAQHLAWPVPWLVGLLFFAFGVGLFVARSGAGLNDRRRHPILLRLVDIPFFIHWCAALFTVVPAVVGTLVSPVLDLAGGRDVSLPTRFYFWLYVVGLAIAAYGILVRRRFYTVKDVRVPIKGLDPKLHGFKIAQLSDLHIGAVTPRTWAERWVKSANAESPDITVVTGDMVTSGVDFHEEIADVVGALKAKLGVYVSMGNHDYFGEGEPLISLIHARGPSVLRNEGRLIERDGARLYLAAIDDTWTKRDDMDKALEGRPDGVPVVLLAHDPERFPAAAKRGVDLTLSGHTHGGQIAVPFLAKWLSLSRLTHQFHLGLYTLGDATLYVHPGLGTTGPPIRLGVAPAVVILTLEVA
jgi:predicted MPP superfamily phosphohydrolase